MKILSKLLGVAFFLAVLIAGIFILCGDIFEQWLNPELLQDLWSGMKPFAWLIATLVLTTDILLPIPGTVVLSALGSVYGLWLGALAGTLGMFLAGSVGYGLGRCAGPWALSKWASSEEVDQAHRLVERWGGWAVVLSRSLPILPEVISLMAGLTGMAYGRFAVALLVGSLPTAFLFSWIGVAAVEEPAWGFALSMGLPAVLWVVFIKVTQGGGYPSSRLCFSSGHRRDDG